MENILDFVDFIGYFFAARLLSINRKERNRPIVLSKNSDLRYIQKLPGHNSSRTPEFYMHISKKAIATIRNPVDELFGEV